MPRRAGPLRGLRRSRGWPVSRTGSAGPAGADVGTSSRRAKWRARGPSTRASASLGHTSDAEIAQRAQDLAGDADPLVAQLRQLALDELRSRERLMTQRHQAGAAGWTRDE